MMQLALDLSPPESKHYASWSDRLAAVARYSQPDEIHTACERAHSIGAKAILAVLDRRTERALRDLQRWRPLSVWAVVPNMYAFIRDLTDRGLVGAALSRFLRLPPSAMVATGWNALRELGPLARSDFSAGALWLAQMELAGASGLDVRRVFLHPQLTEIALAGRVRELFVGFAERARWLGLEAGLVTHNPVVTAELLGDDLDRFAAVVAPCNPKGYKMVPDRQICEALFRSRAERFWASNVTAGGSLAIENGLAHVRALDLGGAVLDAPALPRSPRNAPTAAGPSVV